MFTLIRRKNDVVVYANFYKFKYIMIVSTLFKDTESDG